MRHGQVALRNLAYCVLNVASPVVIPAVDLAASDCEHVVIVVLDHFDRRRCFAIELAYFALRPYHRAIEMRRGHLLIRSSLRRLSIEKLAGEPIVFRFAMAFRHPVLIIIIIAVVVAAVLPLPLTAGGEESRIDDFMEDRNVRRWPSLPIDSLKPTYLIHPRLLMAASARLEHLSRGSHLIFLLLPAVRVAKAYSSRRPVDAHIPVAGRGDWRQEIASSALVLDLAVDRLVEDHHVARALALVRLLADRSIQRGHRLDRVRCMLYRSCVLTRYIMREAASHLALERDVQLVSVFWGNC